jgi:Ca2+-transporting ATPase
LLLWLDSQGVDYVKLRGNSKIIDQLPFSTERKFMATLVDSQFELGRILYLKGAPEIVFSKCNKIQLTDKMIPAEEYTNELESMLTGYQNRAMRTLGFACKRVSAEVKNIDEALSEVGDLVFIGVTAISDPVREDVPDAVRRCLDAGIQVKIVTGDTPNTACEIARQIGLWNENDGDENRITGAEFEALSDEQALERVAKLKVMSRARPMDKQRLVRLLQQRGEVVAVTDDGTNDAPALNFAQVGLSMGSGTSVAKEASDITLLDDSFQSIATAVMWGRSLYRNIQRFVAFQLTINFVALVIVLLGSIFGTEVPLTVTQMLWVNLIMDTFAAAALASLPPNPLVMKDKPRKLSDFIITPQMTKTIFGVGTLFIATLLTMLFSMGRSGEISIESLTIFFTVFVMLQFWNLFNAKTLGASQSAFKEMGKCIPFVLVALLILVGQIIIVKFGGRVFRTVPIDVVTWIEIIAYTSVIFWVGELTRLLKRIRNK